MKSINKILVYSILFMLVFLVTGCNQIATDKDDLITHSITPSNNIVPESTTPAINTHVGNNSEDSNLSKEGKEKLKKIRMFKKNISWIQVHELIGAPDEYSSTSANMYRIYYLGENARAIIGFFNEGINIKIDYDGTGNNIEVIEPK